MDLGDALIEAGAVNPCHMVARLQTKGSMSGSGGSTRPFKQLPPQFCLRAPGGWSVTRPERGDPGRQPSGEGKIGKKIQPELSSIKTPQAAAGGSSLELPPAAV